MSTLYLLHDLSTAMPWNLASIHANKAHLAAYGLEVAPHHPYTIEAIPTHSFLWNEIADGAPVPRYMDAGLNAALKPLEDGKNVLLIDLGANLAGFQSLARLLKERMDFTNHRVKSIFVIGRPMCIFEQRWRWTRQYKEKERLPHLRRIANIAQLVEHDRHQCASVELIADLSDNPKSLRQDDLTAKIFAALDCPAPAPLSAIPGHPLVFGSPAARHLYVAREARNNAWPALDEDVYRSCLLELDGQWGNPAIAPLELRKIFLNEGASSQATLERALGLPEGAFAAPEWLLEDMEVSALEPPDIDKARAFAAELPFAVASPLRQRLENDAVLLTPGQQCLLESLKSRPEEEFGHIGEPGQPIELTVLTMTYNHEKFIAECMDSVLAQHTDFPVRHLVLDHCSQDATPQIIAEYAASHPTIRPVLLNRHRALESVWGLLGRCRSKYAAICDGDDYFTDPLKLRKQVDFLESHPKSALVFHPVRIDYEDGSQPEIAFFPPPEMLPRGLKEEYYLTDLLKGNFIQTNSVVYRWRFTEGLPQWFRPDLCPGDWYWHLLHAEKGKIGFIPQVMSVYRRHANALYVHSFKNDVEHRRLYGMPELETFKAVDEHFNGRYFRQLACLANGVFSKFLSIYIDEGDNSLLEAACDKYPQFGKHFLACLDNLKAKQITDEDPNLEKEV